MARATALYMFLVAARSMSAHGAQFAPPPAFTTSAAARAFSAHAAAYGPPAASSYGELSSPRSFSAHAAAYVPPLVASRAIVGQALPPPGSAPGGPARLPRCRPMAYGALVALVGAGIYMALAPDDNEEDFPGSIRGCWSIKAASSERDSGLTLLAEMFGDPAHNFHCPFSGCSEVVYVFNLSPKDGNDTGGSSNMAIDHIINSAAKSNYMSAGQINVPIVFRGPNGAAAGVGAQHSQCYAAWFAHVPGLNVLAPYSSEDARGLLKAAIRDPDPVVFLENELLESFPVSDEVLDSSFALPIGKAKIDCEGKDVTITAFSKMVGYALQAAEILSKEGISAEVINLRSIRPLDRAAINASVRKTNRLVTLEEGFPQHGVGAEICMSVVEESFEYLDAPVERIAGADVPMPYAANLERLAVPQIEDIVRAARRACYRALPMAATA